MTKEKVSVIIKTGEHEDLYFKEQEQKKIKKLREQIEHESNNNTKKNTRTTVFAVVQRAWQK